MPDSSSRLRLRVAPRAAASGRRSAIVGRHGDAWKIRVAAAPERGRANDEVLAVIAFALGVPRRDVRLVAGSGSRDKIVEVAHVSLAEAERRLERDASRQ